jgi:hypothetical protein
MGDRRGYGFTTEGTEGTEESETGAVSGLAGRFRSPQVEGSAPIWRDHPAAAPPTRRTDMSIAQQWLRHSLVAVAALALLAGCADDSPVGPAATLATASGSDTNQRAVDLGTCDSLSVPTGSRLAFHAYARGTQVYRWDGTGWILVGPSASLFADADGIGVVGTHYAGPTWQSTSGSTVVGAVSKRCSASPDAIQWLLLRAVSSEGPGVFEGVTHIQRVNTAGGKAPTEAGALGEVRKIAYTAEYFFYRGP